MTKAETRLQKITQRALNYAITMCREDRGKATADFLAGYRAAMRDARQAVKYEGCHFGVEWYLAAPMREFLRRIR